MRHSVTHILQSSPVKSICTALFFGAFCALSACIKTDEGVLVIGAVLPTTGDAATFGQNAANGAQLAVEVAAKQKLLGNTKVRLIVEDSRGTPTDAAAAGKKLLDVDAAKLLIGDVTSAGTHTLIPIVTQAKVPLVSPAASDPDLSGKSPFFARVWPSDNYEASVIGKYALMKNYKRMAVIYANTDYGVGMVKALRNTVPTENLVLDIPVERAVADFRPSLKRAQLDKADAFFVVLYPEDGKRFLTQSAEVGVTLPILATATMEDPGIAATPGANRLVFASPVPPDDKVDSRATFLKAYKEKFGKEAGVLSDTGYDSAMILIKAWATAGKTGQLAVVDAIRAMKDYPGMSGTMSFDKNGDVIKSYGLKTVDKGAFTWVKKND